jgi:hypothetical protein
LSTYYESGALLDHRDPLRSKVDKVPVIRQLNFWTDGEWVNEGMTDRLMSDNDECSGKWTGFRRRKEMSEREAGTVFERWWPAHGLSVEC